MPTETCQACGGTFSGDDREAFIDAAIDHYTRVHPEWGLGRTSVVNWVEAKERISGPTERLDSIGGIEVHQVTPDRIEEVLRFFDRDGFAGNPEWAACYCMFYHREDPQTNGGNPWRKNREDLVRRLQEGSTIGYLAYVDGTPAGWCNASLRSAYPVRRKGVDDDRVGVVACFVIAPPYRKHGVSKRLLEAAIEGFKARGVERVEAHPLLEAKEDAPNYHGPLTLYVGAGFEEIERDERSATVAIDLAGRRD